MLVIDFVSVFGSLKNLKFGTYRFVSVFFFTNIGSIHPPFCTASRAALTLNIIPLLLVFEL